MINCKSILNIDQMQDERKLAYFYIASADFRSVKWNYMQFLINLLLANVPYLYPPLESIEIDFLCCAGYKNGTYIRSNCNSHSFSVPFLRNSELNIQGFIFPSSQRKTPRAEEIHAVDRIQGSAWIKVCLSFESPFGL